MKSNTGKKAAFLATNGFCEREFIQAQRALAGLGVNCRLISVENSLIRGWNELEKRSDSDWGFGYAPDQTLISALPNDYDILVIPGGLRSVEKLKLSIGLKAFISSFLESGKPVIAYNKAIDLLYFSGLTQGYDFVPFDCIGDYCPTDLNDMDMREEGFLVSKNLITISKFPAVHSILQKSVLKILDAAPEKDTISPADTQGNQAA